MLTRQETWTIIVLLLLGLVVVVGLFVLRRRSLAPVTRRRHIGVRDTARACSAMHDINPAVACADTMCKDTAPCQETGRAIIPPSEAACDDACDALDKRIREDPAMSDVDLCSYDHCAHMDAYIPVCQTCSIEYPQPCTEEGEYAEAIELECNGVVVADPDYARCAAACADLTEGGTQPEEACFVADGFCSWEYKTTCHPCSFEELDECTDLQIVELIEQCSEEPATVPLPYDFECDNTGEVETRVDTITRVPFFTVSPSIIINDVAVNKTRAVRALSGYDSNAVSPLRFGILLATQTIPCVQPSVVELVPQSAAGMASTMTIIDYEESGLDSAILYTKRDRTISSMTATPLILPSGGRFTGTLNGRSTDFFVWVAAMSINELYLTDGEHFLCTITQASALDLAVGQEVDIEIIAPRLDEEPTTAEKEAVAGHRLMKQLRE